MVKTVYSDQLQVVLSRLEGMTYEEAQKYYNHASKNYGLSDSEIIVLTAAVEKLKQARRSSSQLLFGEGKTSKSWYQIRTTCI